MSHEVHVWQVALNSVGSIYDELVACLSESEQERGRKFLNPDHGRRFFVAHGVMRHILANFLGRSPEKLSFSKTRFGKPYLEDVSLHFNLSHSHEQMLFAISDGHVVGVDIEYVEAERHYDELVARYFTEEEQLEYSRYEDASERHSAFYRAWTRKEAYIKARGMGLSYPLDEFAVSLAPNCLNCLLYDKRDHNAHKSWSVLSLETIKPYTASLAISVNDPLINTHSWSF